MSPTLANFLFEVVNFLILAGALGWVLFKPIRRALAREQARFTSEVERGQQLRREAEALAQEARAAHDGLREELEHHRGQVLQAARRQADALLEDARRSREDERRAFERELEGMRAAQTAAIADAVGRIAADSVRALLERIAGPDLDAALIAAACGELEQLGAGSDAAPALVESARPVPAQARARILATTGPEVRERVVPELGAGVRITTSAGQIDATAAALARAAAKALREHAGSDELGLRGHRHG